MGRAVGIDERQAVDFHQDIGIGGRHRDRVPGWYREVGLIQVARVVLPLGGHVFEVERDLCLLVLHETSQAGAIVGAFRELNPGAHG